MTRTILFSASLVTAVGVLALTASAQDQTPAQTQQRLSLVQVASMLEDQGYTVLEIELEHGRYDVEMIDARGMRVEAHLDAATGDVLPYRDDDDDRGARYDDDDRSARDDD